MNHLLGVNSLSDLVIEDLLERAAEFRDDALHDVQKYLANRTVAFMFNEPSTRTRCSFEVAAAKLGAYPLVLSSATSSSVKGEALLDTARTLVALGADMLVVRGKSNDTPMLLAEHLGVPVVNAGAGTDSHPTQALLDAVTLREALGPLAGHVVVICGDLRHSRVANSNVRLLTRLGASVRLCGPTNLWPSKDRFPDVERFDDLSVALAGASAVMMLRVQHERISDGVEMLNKNDYFRRYGLKSTHLSASPEILVLHPGPMNRGIEIESEVADSTQSLVLRQVTNGMYLRMAVLDWALNPR
jgi:aspartate carbamoyltransferase catalytic subunit